MSYFLYITGQFGSVPARTRLARSWSASIAVFATTVGLVRCGDSAALGERKASTCDFIDYPTGPDDNYRPSIKITTFWSKGADLAAQQFLAERGSHDLAQVNAKDRIDLQKGLHDRWSEAEVVPPDAFQGNGGSDVLKWVYDIDANQAHEPHDSQLCPLNRLDDRYHWTENFFPSALAPVTCKGTLYALPIGIHRVNMLFYNHALLNEVLTRLELETLQEDEVLSLSSSEDFEDLLKQVDELAIAAEEGQALIPLAIDGAGTWPFTLLAFDSLMTSRGNTYEDVWLGRASDSSALAVDDLKERLNAWLKQLKSLSSRSNLAHKDESTSASDNDSSEGQNIGWREGLKLVLEGDALFTTMGDWAWAEAKLDGSSEELSNLRAVPFPGTESTFVYTPDTFAIPRSSINAGAPAHYWLNNVVGDKETQITFANVKQSIPAYANLSKSDIQRLDTKRLQETYKTFRSCQEEYTDCRLRLAVSGLGWSPGTEPCLNQIPDLLFLAMGFTLPDGDPDDSSMTSKKGEGGADGETAARLCETPLPTTQKEAEKILIDRLIETSKRPFAEGCR